MDVIILALEMKLTLIILPFVFSHRKGIEEKMKEQVFRSTFRKQLKYKFMNQPAVSIVMQNYRQTSNISCTLVGNKIVHH